MPRALCNQLRSVNPPSGGDKHGGEEIQKAEIRHVLKVVREVALRRPPGGQGPLCPQFSETGSLSRGGEQV